MRYVKARIKENERDMIYRIYITDSLKAIGGINLRYYDFIDDTPVDTRTGDEIIDHIKNKIDSLG